MFVARAVLEENHTKGGRRSLDFNKIYFILFFLFFFLIAQQVLVCVLQVSQFHAGL